MHLQADDDHVHLQDDADDHVHLQADDDHVHLQADDDDHVHAGVSVGGLSQRQSRGDLND